MSTPPPSDEGNRSQHEVQDDAALLVCTFYSHVYLDDDVLMLDRKRWGISLYVSIYIYIYIYIYLNVNGGGVLM